MATLGRTSIGSTDRGMNGTAKGLQDTIPVNVAAGSVSLWAYIHDASAGDSIQMAVLASDGSTVLAYSGVRTDVGTIGWYQFTGGTLGSFAPAASTVLQIIVGADSGLDASVRYDDAGLTGLANGGSFTPGTPPSVSVAMSSDADRDYSVYMEYTEATSGIEGPMVGGKLTGGGLLMRGSIV